MEKTIQTKTCKNCQQSFEITDLDLDFYKILEIPSPTFCPPCRQQRRLTWRNERTLYKRKCDATGAEIISVFHPDSPMIVYDNDYWYSDKWNPLQYGQDFDFNRQFFEQFRELLNKVPQMARSAVNNENSDYVNQCGWCRNCYLIFEADGNENCLYSNNIYDSKVCMDIYHGTKCELCYQCVTCQNCYSLKYSQDCHNCVDSWFLKSCIGCRDCFGCVNLRNKQYYFLNEKCSKEDYEKKVKAIDLSGYDTIEEYREKFQKFILQFPQKFIHGVQNENSTGDYLNNTQNCQSCFNVMEAQDCKYVYDSRNTKKVYDMSVFGATQTTEFCCDNHEIGLGVKNICFSDQIWNGSYEIYYSKACIDTCHDLFGCIGLKHKEYCILNKQYSKEEYQTLRAKVVEHMKKTGEYGEFFPSEISPFKYNETISNDYFPLSKEDALKKNFQWRDDDPKEYQKQTYKIPTKISEAGDDILDVILACKICGKNYKINLEELNFYKRQNLPIPSECHDCRHKRRFKLRNPRQLHKRNCQKCNLEIITTFSPKQPEIVYCENCYLQSLN